MPTDELVTDQRTIMAAKWNRLNERKAHTPMDAIRALAAMQSRPAPILNTVTSGDEVSLIGSVSHKLSDTGHLTEAYDPVRLAMRYQRDNLDSVALFTDNTIYPRGMDDLTLVARAVRKPVISMNYILDEYHIVESRAAGAAALVLSSDVHDFDDLRNLISATVRNRMTAIVHITSPKKLGRVLSFSPHAIAFSGEGQDDAPDYDQLVAMRDQVPSHIRVVSFYPLYQVADLEAILAAGVDGLLVDEIFWAENDLGARLRSMVAQQPQEEYPPDA